MPSVIKKFSAILAVFFWFSSLALWRYFASYRGAKYQPEIGRIYPLKTHGSITYLTANEHYLLYGFIYFGALFFLATVIMHFLKR